MFSGALDGHIQECTDLETHVMNLVCKVLNPIREFAGVGDGRTGVGVVELVQAEGRVGDRGR